VREPGVGQHLDRIQSETGIALPDNLNYFFASDGDRHDATAHGSGGCWRMSHEVHSSALMILIRARFLGSIILRDNLAAAPYNKFERHTESADGWQQISEGKQIKFTFKQKEIQMSSKVALPFPAARIRFLHEIFCITCIPDR
jgi:hypothetical protein